jgi:hypothetical protein
LGEEGLFVRVEFEGDVPVGDGFGRKVHETIGIRYRVSKRDHHFWECLLMDPNRWFLTALEMVVGCFWY